VFLPGTDNGSKNVVVYRSKVGQHFKTMCGPTCEDLSCSRIIIIIIIIIIIMDIKMQHPPPAQHFRSFPFSGNYAAVSERRGGAPERRMD